MTISAMAFGYKKNGLDPVALTSLAQVAVHQSQQKKGSWDGLLVECQTHDRKVAI